MKRRNLLVAVISALVLVVGFASPAHAQTVSKSYSISKRINVGGNICATVKLTGKMRGTVTYIHGSRNDRIRLSKPRLASPSISASYAYCTRPHARKVTSSTVTQLWHYTGCKWNPSISASVPFAVSASVTPTCGNFRAARASAKGGKGYGAALRVSGETATWNRTETYPVRTKKYTTCIRAAATVKVRTGNTTYARGKPVDFGNVCLKW
ncbi:hypothetical protein H1W00_02495 [Aeromicrobium sp. Marseille-Q0843]|uniref:Uncharacterized protein n=1 Tax=Aeromicrobium phoceense TaxID=2754045 RepID=A0A838XKE6_9ACTN|nr:hypothetical protein [Aeromicrobium phoceense]MBA4607340.1 hypothetical protein [Aeromicrobium phoceense]